MLIHIFSTRKLKPASGWVNRSFHIGDWGPIGMGRDFGWRKKRFSKWAKSFNGEGKVPWNIGYKKKTNPSMDGEIDVTPKIESSMILFTEEWENPFISICKMFSGNFLPKSGRIGLILLIIPGLKGSQASFGFDPPMACLWRLHEPSLMLMFRNIFPTSPCRFD